MYKAREQKDILQEMINSSKAKTGLFEGTFQYDALASNSIEFAKVEVELEETKQSRLCRYITRRISDHDSQTVRRYP